jgi:GAF domain-containing protein
MPLLMFAATTPPEALDVVDRVVQKPASMRTITSVVGELVQGARIVPESAPVRARLACRSRLRAAGELLDRTDPVAARMLSALTRELAAQTGASTAAVTLVLADTVIYVASFGLPGFLDTAGGVPAEWAPCADVVTRDAAVLVSDTHANAAVRQYNPVVALLGVRSYAGVPLRNATGIPVGTLCVVDRAPHAFTPQTIELLSVAAAHAERLLRTTTDGA